MAGRIQRVQRNGRPRAVEGAKIMIDTRVVKEDISYAYGLIEDRGY